MNEALENSHKIPAAVAPALTCLDTQFSMALPDFILEGQCKLPRGISGLIGPSGAGKTSLARFLAGHMRAQKGFLSLNGKRLFDSDRHFFVKPEHRHIGYMPQEAHLFPHKNLDKNLAYGQKNHFAPKARTARRDMAEALGLSALLERPIHSLSGGEAKRGALARALLARPSFLILDEPFAGLDPDAIRLVREQLIKSAETQPMLIISHDFENLLELAPHSLLLSQGKIIAQGPSLSLLDAPEAARLFGKSQGGTSLIVLLKRQGKDIFTHLGPHPFFLADGMAFADGARAILQIKSRHIALASPQLSPEAAASLSIRNQIPALIIERQDRHNSSFITLCLTGSDIILSCQISQESAERLNLQKDKTVTALIKSEAVSLQKLTN